MFWKTFANPVTTSLESVNEIRLKSQPLFKQLILEGAFLQIVFLIVERQAVISTRHSQSRIS
jgi:hypothetical protein